MEERDTNQFNNEYKGHPLESVSMGSFYDKNNRMSFILKKTEKIVTAIYMVTDFMPESEPLKKELRTLGVSLMSQTRQLSTKATEPDYGTVDDIKCGSESASSFINLAVTIGLVSNMNGSILLNELQKNVQELLSLYKDNRVSVITHPGYSNIILNKEMFEVSEFEVAKIEVPVKGQLDKGQEVSINVLNKNVVKEEQKKESASKATGLGIKIARRNDVLNIVKAKGQVSVKDILLMLKDVSEKTVQRELFSLVKEGVLKKEGEKRWSVYKLV